MSNNLLIVGAGQYGQVTREVAISMNKFNKIDFLDDSNDIAIGKIGDYSKFLNNYKYAIVAIGNSEVRSKILDNLVAAGFQIPILIHKNAYVSESAIIKKGCIIEANTTVNTDSQLGTGTIVSAGAIINHNSIVNDFCHIDVGAIIPSNCTVPGKTKVEAGMVYKKS